MDDLPPVIPKPTTRCGWDIVCQRFLQVTVEIEIRTTGEPVDSIFLEGRRCIGWKGHSNRTCIGIGVGFLIRVMHALPCITCDDLDVHFMIVVFVKEGAVACASDSASLERSAYASIENVIIPCRDLGSEDGRCGLASRYLQLQGSTIDGYIGCGVQLGVWR